MVRIEQDIKLDFKDVLIRPKRSTLRSRSQVSVERKIVFKHSGQEWDGVPVMVANMDTTGTFEMAKAVHTQKVITCMHKHYSLDEWKAFAEECPEALPYITVSAGTSKSDFEMVQAVLSAIPAIRMICIDVANGYSEHFVDTVKAMRKEHPTHTIIAGNVVTGEMVEELVLSGADVGKLIVANDSINTLVGRLGNSNLDLD
jgi:GMP reductase